MTTSTLIFSDGANDDRSAGPDAGPIWALVFLGAVLLSAGGLLLDASGLLPDPAGSWLWLPATAAVGILGFVLGQRWTAGARRAELEAMRQDRNMLQHLMENLPDAIYFKDTQSRFLRINLAVVRRFSLAEAAQAVGRSDRDFFTEDFARQTLNDEQEVIQTGRPLVAKEEKESWPDGRETWASTTTVPFRDSAGEVVGVIGISHDITERKRAEESLRQAEAKYRSIFENAVEGIYQTTSDGRFLTANPMLARIYGFESPEKLIEQVGPANHMYCAPGRRAEFIRQMELHQSLTGFESQIHRRDGQPVWISENARTIHDADGRVVGYEGTVVDITPRKRTEEELRATNETLEALIQAAPLAILTLDQGGVIRSWNTAAEQMFGWTEAEVIGRPTPLIPTDRQDEFRDLVERLTRGEAFAGVQARRQRKDGSLVDVSISAAPLYAGGREVRGIVVLFSDISGIKHTEQVLARERALLRGLIDSIPDHIFYKDRHGTYLGCNKAFEKYVGRSEREIIGRTAHDLFPGQVGHHYGDLDRQVLDDGKPHRIEQGIEYPDGRRLLVEVLKTPYYGPDGCILGLIGMTQDITERKRLEEQLRQSQKMEAIGQLAGGIAHDFNNLLTAILGNIGLLLADPATSEAGCEPLREIERAAVRAADLTRQLLGFSRQTMLRLEPTALGSAIEEIVGMLRRAIDPRIRLEVHADADAWPVQADPGQMNQVLMNLCLNARDAMPQGGLLCLETANVTVDEDHTRRHLDARAGEFVRLRVADTGHGIPPEIRRRIFDPFFTTKAPGKGTGLGLAMVFGIIKQHQGWIECHSEVGRGTTFEIYLPRCQAPSADRRVLPTASSPNGGTETILLVDDESVIRDLGQTILRRHGYRVLLAADGPEAIEIYQREQGRIDLVILDLTMPRLSGRDTWWRLLQIDPEVRILVSSGYSAEFALEPEQEGLLGFVHKPYRPQELVASVRQALDKVQGLVTQLRLPERREG